jgi:hypothetical protein
MPKVLLLVRKICPCHPDRSETIRPANGLAQWRDLLLGFVRGSPTRTSRLPHPWRSTAGPDPNECDRMIRRYGTTVKFLLLVSGPERR